MRYTEGEDTGVTEGGGRETASGDIGDLNYIFIHIFTAQCRLN